jgi:hypothetical protein
MPLQYAASILPKQECTVADNAPGRLAMEGAPIDRARTTAKAEFCIPVSMDMVRLIFSPNPNPSFGTRYPARNPKQCKPKTAETMSGIKPFEVDTSKEVFSATTPPQINATNTTLQKGVNLDTLSAKLGALALTSIPNKTGNKTTLAVAAQSVQPDTAIVLPTRTFTNRGVTILAKIVEHDVNMTDNATSALAINDTRLEAVPPGEHPTKHSPRKRALP